MIRLIIIFVILCVISVTGFAQDSSAVSDLKQRIEQLEQKIEQDELSKLLEEADKQANESSSSEQKEKNFKSKSTSLQALNPEISGIGDFYTQYQASGKGFDHDSRSGAFFRTIALHLRSDLDPFSFTKISFEWGADGAEVTEGYMVLSDLLPATSVKVGYFRQQFGTLNRWHEHALDQYDIPLALETFFGGEGLTQAGVSFAWLMPALTADVNQLTLEVTNSQNENLFAGEFFSTPSFLAHLKNYWDINENSYFELGLSGLAGTNHSRGYIDDQLVEESSRASLGAGFDMTYLWEPPGTSKYRSFVWRTEGMFFKKELAGNRESNAFGGFSYAQWKFNERFDGGVRVDYLQPPDAVSRDVYEYQIVPYLTYLQSEWVTMRIQYSYHDGNAFGPADQRFTLHFKWAAGPHLHDRY